MTARKPKSKPKVMTADQVLVENERLTLENLSLGTRLIQLTELLEKTEAQARENRVAENAARGEATDLRKQNEALQAALEDARVSIALRDGFIAARQADLPTSPAPSYSPYDQPGPMTDVERVRSLEQARARR